MTRRRVVQCDWCGDCDDADVASTSGLPYGWRCVTAEAHAPKAIRELGSWDLCPDCILAHQRAGELLRACAEDAWEKAIAGQLRPRREGRGHSKDVLKGRDG